MPLQPKFLVIVAPCLRFPFYAFSAHVCQRQAGQSADCRLGLWVSFLSPSPSSPHSPCPVSATALNCLLCRPKLHCTVLCPVMPCPGLVCRALPRAVACNKFMHCIWIWGLLGLCIAFTLPPETVAWRPVGNCDCAAWGREEGKREP